MSTSPLKTATEAAFTAVRTLLGGGVAVTSGTRSCMAIVKYSSQIEMTGRGTVQPLGGSVRALYDELGDVSLDVACTVGGKKVYPQNPQIDSAAACITFDFTAMQPTAEGVL